MRLCLNCLGGEGVVDVPVGTELGGQRDPYRETLALCIPCRRALVTGDLRTFSQRYSEERTIRREPPAREQRADLDRLGQHL